MSPPNPQRRSQPNERSSSSEYFPFDIEHSTISPSAAEIDSSPPSVGWKSSSDYSPSTDFQVASPTVTTLSGGFTGGWHSTGNTPTKSKLMDVEGISDREASDTEGMLQPTATTYSNSSQDPPTPSDFINLLSSEPRATRTARPDYPSWYAVSDRRSNGHESLQVGIVCGATVILRKKRTVPLVASTEATLGLVTGLPIQLLPWELVTQDITERMSTMTLKSAFLQVCLALWQLNNQDVVTNERKEAAKAAADGFCAEMEIETAEHSARYSHSATTGVKAEQSSATTGSDLEWSSERR